MPLPKEANRYSYVEYQTWPQEERWELIDGVPFMQAAPSRVHQEISMELSTQLHSYLKGKPCKVFAAPFCVRLDAKKDEHDIKNVVEPDIAVICDSSKLDDRGCKGAPDMIVEIISPSSVKMDRFVKLNKYEEAGVKEYWIVEPDQKLVSVFTLQHNGKYGRPDMYTESDSVKVSVLDNLTIDLHSVFENA